MVAAVRGVEREAVQHVAVAGEKTARDLVGRSDNGERVEHVVVDGGAHLFPLALFRQCVELGVQVVPAVQFEHAFVGGRRTVERDLTTGADGGLFHFFVGGAGDDERRDRKLEVAALAVGRLEATVERRQRDLADVALGGEAVHEHAVAHFAAHLGHLLADRREKHLGRTVRVRAGVEKRRHQRVGIELAAELELGAVVPAVPDGAHGQHVLAHAGRGVRPRHRETLLDVGFDLGAKAEQEAALGRELQVVGGEGNRHRAATESDRDPGAEFDRLGVFGAKQDGKERVVGSLRGPHSGVARVFLGSGVCAYAVGRSTESKATVNVHDRRLKGHGGGVSWLTLAEGGGASTVGNQSSA